MCYSSLAKKVSIRCYTPKDPVIVLSIEVPCEARPDRRCVDGVQKRMRGRLCENDKNKQRRVGNQQLEFHFD